MCWRRLRMVVWPGALHGRRATVRCRRSGLLRWKRAQGWRGPLPGVARHLVQPGISGLAHVITTPRRGPSLAAIRSGMAVIRIIIRSPEAIRLMDLIQMEGWERAIATRLGPWGRATALATDSWQCLRGLWEHS